MSHRSGMSPADVKCAECGERLTAEAPGAPREPCPKCGSTRRVVEAAGATLTGTWSLTAAGEVERGVNVMRATVLFLLLTIGLTVGFGAPWSWWARLGGSIVAVVLSALFVAVALRYRPVRNQVMRLMHLLTDARQGGWTT
jgi:hypothetical protein